MTGTQAPARGRNWTETWLAPAAVAVAAAVVVAPSLGGGFVADDPASVVDNPLVRAPGSAWRVLAGAFSADPFGYTRPLRTIEFALDSALFGDGPLSFRIHSLLWHVAACVLLLSVLRRLLGDGRAAFAAALLWAVHPAQIEPVAWISARGDVAMGACALLAVLCALKSRGGDRFLAVSLVAAAVATLFKETAALLPAVVALLRWTRLSRAPLWPYFALSGAYALARLLRHAPPASDAGFVLGGSFEGTLATMTRAFGFYVVDALLPSQSFDWYMAPSTSFADGAAAAWLALHGALVVSAALARRRAPLWTLSVGWFYAFLLAVANWPVFVGKPTSERYMYLSLAGAALGAGWALVRAPRAAWAAALVAAATFGCQSFRRSFMWRSDADAYAAVVADHESPGARYYFACEAQAQAVDLLRAALAMPEGAARSETTARARRRVEEALDQAHRAIDVWRAYDPTSPSRSPILRRFEIAAAADCYLALRFQEALFHAEEALRIHAMLDGRAEHDRALPLLALGYAPQAAAEMKRALAAGFARDDETAAFFLRAAAKCEADGLLTAAEDCCASAMDAAVDDALRRAARDRLFALRRRPRAAGADEAERAAVARLDADLARLPRSCPAR